MKKTRLTVIAIIVFMLSGFNNSYSQVVVKVKPVRTNVVVVKKPTKPGKNFIWIEGHWKWNKRRQAYVWIDGKWAKRQGNKSWVAGHWRKTRGGWTWIPGHWA